MTETASTANPYASFLGDRDPLEVIDETPRHLAGLLAPALAGGGSPALVRQPAPGKWSVRDILCHLADVEIAFGFRLRQAIADENHVIQPFDQDRWASAFSSLRAEDALAAFTAARRWNVLFIRAMPNEAKNKRVSHPERGSMTFWTIVETMGGHDLNHRGQIERMVAT
jgi:uncharacterized damage-inducible protein DinB